MDKAIEIRGHAYTADGSGHHISVQDTVSRSEVAAAVKVFARYAQYVNVGDVTNYYVVAPDTGEIVWHTEPVADLQRAIDHVRDDQRQSDPDFSAREAVEYAREVLTLDHLDDSDAVSYEAYRKVLLATTEELTAAFDRR